MNIKEENALRATLERAGWRTWNDHAGYTISDLDTMLQPHGLRLVVEERDWGRLPRGRQELWFRVEPLRPRRIQRSRARGSKLPPNTVCVTRPGRWGNPFKVGDPHPDTGLPMTADAVKRRFLLFLQDCVTGQHLACAAKAELLGKNLACWCKIGAPCHADVLLKLVNDL